MIIIPVLFILIFTAALPLAILITINQSKAKKQAQRILAGEEYNPKELKGILRTLSNTRDNEGKRLYSKLADFADKRR